MVIELKVISNLYSPPDKKGNQKLIKSDIISKLLINTIDIIYVEEIFDDKGKLLKDMCLIKIGEEIKTINHKYSEIKNLICPIKKHTGF